MFSPKHQGVIRTGKSAYPLCNSTPRGKVCISGVESPQRRPKERSEKVTAAATLAMPTPYIWQTHTPPDNPARWVLLSCLYRDGHQAQRSAFLNIPQLTLSARPFRFPSFIQASTITYCQAPYQALDRLVSGRQ